MQVEREIRQFAARVARGAFLGGLADGAALGALAFAALLLVLRLVGVGVAPAWWWTLPACLTALVTGTVRVLRLGFGPRASAQHLDRRLGLEGLLVTSQEVETEAWEARLQAGLQRVADARPHVDGRRLAGRAALAAVLVAGVALLPPVRSSLAHHDPLGAEVLAELEEKLAALEASGVLEQAEAQEIERRIEGVRAGAKKDGVLSWSDVDTVEERLEHEKTLKAGRLAKAVEALAAFQNTTHDTPTTAADAARDALEAAADAGLLDKLPPELRAQLGLDPRRLDGASLGEGLEGLDATDLALDPEALKQLAEALAGLAGDELDALEGAELLEGLDLEALDAKLAEALGEWKEGEPCKLCDGSDEDCPG